MKNFIFLGILAALTLPAGATLIGDDVTGSASQGGGANLFGAGTTTTAPVTGGFTEEFHAGGITGILDPGGANGSISDISVGFYFEEFGGTTYLTIAASRGTSTDPFSFTNLSVDFSSINFGLPGDYIFDTITTEVDPGDEAAYLQGLAVDPPGATSLSLTFTDFLASDTRYIDLVLTFKENTNTGDPVPEPASIAMLACVLSGMAISRKRRKSA